MNKLIPVISLLAVLMATAIFLTQSDDSDATSLGDLSDPKQSIGNEIYNYDSAYLVVGGTLNLSGYEEEGDYYTWPTGITSGYGFTFTSGSIPFNNTITGTATQTGTVTIQIRYEYPNEGVAGNDTITLYVVPSSYVISIESSNTAYGTVDESIVYAPYGTPYSVSGNTLTIGTTVITATPSSATAQYSYAFDSWSGVPAGGTVTGDVTITANFTRTVNQYTVTFDVNNAEYGSVSHQSLTVDYGTEITRVWNVLNIGDTNIVATVTPADAQYTYSFIRWSGIPSTALVTNDITVTANFTRTVNQYTVTFTMDSGSGSWTYPTIEVDYGSTISWLDNVVLVNDVSNTFTTSAVSDTESYSFEGFTGIPADGIIVGDITVYAETEATFSIPAIFIIQPKVGDENIIWSMFKLLPIIILVVIIVFGAKAFFKSHDDE